MSWMISNALMADYENSRSSQEQAAEFWADTCSDGALSVQLNVMPTPHRFWFRDRTMEACDLSRFGLTLRLLTAEHGEGLLTWYQQGFRAKTFRSAAKARVLTENDPDYGEKSCGSFAMLHPITSSWRTHQRSLFGGWEQFSETWPRWGMMRAGVCFRLEMLAHDTSVKGSGLSLPTPGKNEHLGTSRKRYRHSVHFRGAKTSEALRICDSDPAYLTVDFAEDLMLWPTMWTKLAPLATDKFQSWRRLHGASLEASKCASPR